MIADDVSHVDEWGPEKIVTVTDPRCTPTFVSGDTM